MVRPTPLKSMMLVPVPSKNLHMRQNGRFLLVTVDVESVTTRRENNGDSGSGHLMSGVSKVVRSQTCRLLSQSNSFFEVGEVGYTVKTDRLRY